MQALPDVVGGVLRDMRSRNDDGLRQIGQGGAA